MIPIYQSTAQGNRDALARLLNRSTQINSEELAAVQEILKEVKSRGDQALFAYTKKFDGAEITAGSIVVSQQEYDEAYQAVAPALLQTMRRSAHNIRAFHEKQKRQSWFDTQDGRILGQMIRPLQRVGVYVPGWRASYPSSVFMNVLPAKIAGVREVIMVTPPGKDGKIDPLTLVSAKESGVDVVYKVGGAQAVAALAYGTQSIPRVDKITGPGNIYVALAKREVYGVVGIDMIAGPSEVMILADAQAKPQYIAADLLAQAEHDPMSAAILITDSEQLAYQVQSMLESQLSDLPKADIARASIENHGGIVIVDDLRRDGVLLANQMAPEHLELLVRDPFEWLGSIENAGAIFLGEHAPEPLGDYFAGPNHVLPTNGTARFFSPLSVDDFCKKSSVIYYTRAALESAYEDIVTFAEAEHLHAHARSAGIRFQDDV